MINTEDYGSLRIIKVIGPNMVYDDTVLADDGYFYDIYMDDEGDYYADESSRRNYFNE